jgi:hypothetical protein
MSNPPFQPGAVHTEDEFEDDGGAQMNEIAAQGDPNWDVPPNVPPTNVAQAATPDDNNNPLASAEEASKIAGAALHLCDANAMELNNKLYLKLEAWTGIARIAGTVPGIETVKDNVLGGVPGVTARSSLKNGAGKLLSEAEGFVGQDEAFWASKPVSDRVNMAQTRAVGRVCRLVFSFIVQIMNKEYGRHFEVTPAEEMLASMKSQPYGHLPPPDQMQPPPAMGQRHVMPQAGRIGPDQSYGPQDPNWQRPQPQYPPQPPQTWQPPTQPPQTVVYPDSHAFVPQPSLPAGQYPMTPNQAQPVGQGGVETWQAMIRDIQIKWIPSKKPGMPQSQLFIAYTHDGRNATTFDKTVAGSLEMCKNRNVEMMVQARGNGRYNIMQVRPL